jgi:hypothetical protein
MKAARPEPPKGLGRAGARAGRAAHAALAEDVEFSAAELERLRLIAGQTDTVAALEVDGSPTSLTAARSALARLWNELDLEPDETQGLAPPVRDKRSQKAAQARWRAKAELQKQRARLGA